MNASLVYGHIKLISALPLASLCQLSSSAHDGDVHVSHNNCVRNDVKDADGSSTIDMALLQERSRRAFFDEFLDRFAPRSFTRVE
ncbi:hypothetical protein AURDEDRAFT_171716 [Auricularia subglabra TFB-10046 SS5]|nr:hypothetical protein AURDEDRAFT_171716 [Auricularia subglabra TFB-10046 SS5]